jgi:hypothetical protein
MVANASAGIGTGDAAADHPAIAVVITRILKMIGSNGDTLKPN